MDAALLPVKRLDRAKSRLSDHFGDAARAQIAHALLEDAFDLAADSDFLVWTVVSDDDAVLAAARRRGFEALEDDGRGMNNAVRHGLERIAKRKVDSVTVIPADVPLAWRGDLQDLLDTGATSDVVVVPSRSDGGTNGLYLSPPELMEPQFGPHSMRAHVRTAERLRVRCAILSLPRLELDIDTIEDVDTFLAAPQHSPGHAARVLGELAGRR